MFFGIILLIIGLSIILPKIPVFNVLLGIALIVLGISMFLNKDFKSFFNYKTENIIIFNEGNFEYNDKFNEYVTVFGNTQLNLTKAKPTSNKKISVVTAFGNIKLFLDKNSNFNINSVTVFGSSKLPNQSKEGFGEIKTKSDIFDEKKPYLNLDVVSVFGNIEIIYVDEKIKTF